MEAVEAEVPLDPLEEPLHGGVGPNRPTAAALPVGALQAGPESFLIGLLEYPFERAPLPALEVPHRLTLRHAEVPPGVRALARGDCRESRVPEQASPAAGRAFSRPC